MEDNNPNIKRRKQDETSERKFKFDEDATTDPRRKFKSDKSGGRFKKGNVEDDDTNNSEPKE